MNTNIKTNLKEPIDKDVQSIFRPMNLMQIILLNPKYHVKNNMISPNNSINNLILISGFIIFAVTYIYRIVEIVLDENFVRYSYFNPFFYMCASIFDFVVRFSGFIMNFMLNFGKTRRHVLATLCFQEVHRCIKSENSTKRFILNSWLFVTGMIGYYIFLMIYLYFVLLRPPLNGLFYILCIITIDTSTIYFLSLIILLKDKIMLWNLALLVNQENERRMCSKKMEKAYENILKCYAITKENYQQLVFYHILEALLQSLGNIKLLIDIIKFYCTQTEDIQVSMPVVVIVWVIKRIVTQIVLCLILDSFYEAVNNSYDACITVLASDCSDDQRRLCKNVLRLHRASFSKLRVCGMFYVDVCHLLRLIELLTNYTIVLLQFALL